MNLDVTTYFFSKLKITLNGSYIGLHPLNEDVSVPDWSYLKDAVKSELLIILPTPSKTLLIAYMDEEFDAIEERMSDLSEEYAEDWHVDHGIRTFIDLKYWFYKLAGVPLESDEEEEKESTLPDVDLQTQREQIRLINDLGILKFLQEQYPATLKGNNNQIAKLLSQILRVQQTSVQPSINALLNDQPSSDKYPKETPRTKAIISVLNSAESD